MSKKKKGTKIWKVLVALLVVIILLFAGTLFFINNILKSAVEKVGSMVTDTDVKVKNIDLSFRKGELLINDFVVGNPEAYKTDNALSLSKIYVALEPKSIFSDTIRIKEIIIEDPSLTYEVGLGNSNLGTILENVNSFAGADDDKKDKADKDKKADKGSKKVVIEHVLVQGGKINLSAKLLGGNALPVSLPKVELNDIGKESENGTDFIEAYALIFREMLQGAVKAAASSGKDILKGGADILKKSGKEALESGKSALKETQKALEERSKDGAEDGKDMLQGGKEAVEETGKAIQETGKKIGEGIKGIFGNKKE